MLLCDHSERSAGRRVRACRLDFPCGNDLRLRPLRHADRDDFLTSIDSEVRHWQGWNDEVLGSMRATFVARTRLTLAGYPSELAIVDRHSGAFAGVVGITLHSLNPRDDLPSLGWWLSRQARGRGLGHESLALALDYVHRVIGVPEVQIGTRATNAAALAQIRRSGADHLCDELIETPDGAVGAGHWFIHR